MSATDRPPADETRHGVGCALDGGVAVVTLRRPSAGNALDASMRAELIAAVRRVRGEGDRVRAVLLTAEGRHFCVGQDLKEHARALESAPASAFAVVRDEYNPLVEELRALPQPVVAAVEGACVGAGLGLALCADVRVAGAGARFSTAFTGIGLAADSGLSGALARAVGPSRAAALMLLGDRFDATAAQRWGLVHSVVPDGGAAAEGLALAQRLAAGPTAAYAEVKSLLRADAAGPLSAVLEREAAAQERLGTTEDHRAAVRAFLEVRQPPFTGH
ncbi:enoyl-CoA hydratase-related protein [Streptomyces caniscabiei]|uniref:enoyl-CoA hydratase/isomerase family protein n=1 Tax=Streptomyces caniscabiei TaxID=2746961 RepID=UPI00299FF44D|nr:enoyl-CoA hydratase-related protein [Streptomyces caniscabiei]MDX2605023.1 enoyl-CoA hydratase-related protein [Streptomyces caniscabiei]MDX2735587.1 enoyl-CoA hydratase-related protein [Streptomyces caniscabiei]MDX2777010.1 enoyl-CoA hydratase-related protein [Streptomyces caniscabiei]